MNRYLPAILLLVLLLPALSCKGKVEELPEGTRYEKAIPDPVDVPSGSELTDSIDPRLNEKSDAVDADPDDPMARLDYLMALKRSGKPKEALEQARALAKIGLLIRMDYKDFVRIVLDDIPDDDLESIMEALNQIGAYIEIAGNKTYIKMGYLDFVQVIHTDIPEDNPDRDELIMEMLDEAGAHAVFEGDRAFIGISHLNFAQIVLDDIPESDPDRDELIREALNGLHIGLWEPESIPAHIAYGRLNLEVGDYDKALHHLAIALTAIEIGYDLRIRMAEIYIEKGDKEKAIAHLEAARDLARAEGNDDIVSKTEEMLAGFK